MAFFIIGENLAFYVRPLDKGDISQVTEIDHEAFPNEWPAPNYYRELKNPLAHYVVACDAERKIEVPKAVEPKGFSRLALKLKQFLTGNSSQENESAHSQREYIVGFGGIWMMANEAHIINIAVRKDYQRKGIGELLLMAIIDVAMKLDGRAIILEVRASNTPAQRLYYKYGFVKIGVRRGYYKDNGEDGIMMSLINIGSASVQENLRRLKESYTQKWGLSTTGWGTATGIAPVQPDNQ
ncbi:MAG: ribosomal-protein-alanine N-acetyltransferase [Chloroflexi bacterium]|nr:ribosomal-protein-alanine N-acetyltransferase [Chloroflexota bacterium]